MHMSALLVLAAGAFACVVGGAQRSTSDNADLVQGRLVSREAAVDPTDAGGIVLNLSNATNVSNFTLPPPVPFVPMYVITFEKTWGDDHVCLTEIEFYDTLDNVMPATLVEASSCWGCAVSCNGCTADYGNPNVLFDGEVMNDSPSAYFCTDFGSFAGGGVSGSPSIRFQLTTRPHRYALRRPDVLGSAIAKKWYLEEGLLDGDFHIVSNADEKPKELNQSTFVTEVSGPVGRWYEYETEECMEAFTSIPPPTTDEIKPIFETVSNADFQNNGHGIYIDGDFGALRVNGVLYYTKQIHFQFPSKRLLGEMQDIAVGEIHITSQKSDGRATTHLHANGVLVVVIPLRLPLEGTAPSDTQIWFQHTLGLDKVPGPGVSQPIVANFSLNAFSEQLNGTYREIPCRKRNAVGQIDVNSPIWYIVDNPAYVTGAMVQYFKDAFPYDHTLVGNFRPIYVDGKKQTLTYDIIGRPFAVPVKPKPYTEEWETDPITEVVVTPTVDPVEVPGMHWRPNPNFRARGGEFTPMGEWYVPPPTAAPTAQPTTVDPIPELLREVALEAKQGDLAGVRKLVAEADQAKATSTPTKLGA